MNSPTNPSTIQQDPSKQAVQNASQKGQEGQKNGSEQGGKQDTQGGSAVEETSKR